MIIVRDTSSTHLLELRGLVLVVYGSVAVLLANPLLSASLLSKWWWWWLGKQSFIPLVRWRFFINCLIG